MRLKSIVLEQPMKFTAPGAQYSQLLPSAHYQAENTELDYDLTTGLVCMQRGTAKRWVHISRVAWMELDESKATNEMPEWSQPIVPTHWQGQCSVREEKTGIRCSRAERHDGSCQYDSHPLPDVLPLADSELHFQTPNPPKVDKRSKAYRAWKKQQQENGHE